MGEDGGVRKIAHHPVHDVGGQLGYGAPQTFITQGVAGSAFAERWEAKVFAMMRALGAAGVMKNSDQFRHAVERVDPAAYFAHGYYGRWLGGLEMLLMEAGALDRATLDNRVGELAVALGATRSQVEELTNEKNIASRAKPCGDVETLPNSVNMGSSVRYVAQPPKFRLGQEVQATGLASETVTDALRHTRLPGYAQGCVGTIVEWHKGWVLPDSNAHRGEEQPTHLYSVAFASQTLYGADAEAGVVVHLDLFEPYLSAVG